MATCESLNEQLTIYQHNLALLEQQRAQFGGDMSTPLHVLNQIAATRKTIEQLKAELVRLGCTTLATPPDAAPRRVVDQAQPAPQHGGINLTGATIGDNATFAGRDLYGGGHVAGDKNVGRAEVSGGIVYGAVVGNNSGTITTNQHFSTASAYQLACTPPDAWHVGETDDVEVRVQGHAAAQRYQLTVRGQGIATVTQRFVGHDPVCVPLTPTRAGQLSIRIILADEQGTQLAAIKTTLLVSE